MSASEHQVGLVERTQQVSAARFAAVLSTDRIAAARDTSEVYRRGGLALAALLDPACCIFFDRDEFGHLGLAHRLNMPDRAHLETVPLAIAEQVQSWWMATLEHDGPPTGLRLTLLPDEEQTYVAPLIAAGEMLHGMVVLQDCRNALDGDVEREACGLITAISLTLHVVRQREQLADAVSPEQVEEAITQERRRIAREIHDGVAQSLAYLNLKAELLDRLVERNPAGAREQAAVVRQMLQTAMTDLRRCIGDLRRPAVGQGAAITAQLRSMANSITDLPRLELALQQVSGARLAPEVERTVIGIVREALHNIRKHAEANSVHLEVTREDDTLHLLVADDGRGFAVEQSAGEEGQHFGLTQMRELAHELGGKLVVNSQPGSGTRVEALIPLKGSRPLVSSSKGDSGNRQGAG